MPVDIALVASMFLGFTGAYALLWDIRKAVVKNTIDTKLTGENLELLKNEIRTCPLHNKRKEV